MHSHQRIRLFADAKGKRTIRSNCGFQRPDCAKNGHRRPLPLRLEPSPEVISPHDEQIEDQTTLQDAAVKSATSLIAVVNDMLRSPLASARLPPPSSTLAPSYGRPRSRTAPSTPLVEAPSHTLVELPGSIPERPRGSQHHSYDSKLQRSMRPSSHLRRPSHPWLDPPVDRKDDQLHGDHENGIVSESIPPSTPQQQQSEVLTARTCRYSKPVAHQRRIWSDPIQSHGVVRPVSTSSTRNTGANQYSSQLPSTPRRRSDDFRPSYDGSSRSTEEGSHAAHASSLQASHEAHITALTEAHQREIASLRLYIKQLEPRHGLARSSEIHAHPSERHYSLAQSEVTNPHSHPWQSVTPGHGGYMGQSNPTNHMQSAGDSHCTSAAGCGEIWLECNHLRDTLEKTNTRLMQSHETIFRMQAAEKLLKTTIGDLQSRLEAANDQRLDAQEGLHDACCRVRGLAEREANLVLELEELQRCSSASTSTEPSDKEHASMHTQNSRRDSEQDGSQDGSTTSSDSHSSVPSLSPSHTPSPSALGISIPQTPRTIASTTLEALLVTTESPNAYTQPRTPPASVHKELPLLPVNSSPVPVRRGGTMKSVGESIIELYAGRDGEGWERGRETGWVEWV